MWFAGAGIFIGSAADGFFEADASLKTKHNNPKGLRFLKVSKIYLNEVCNIFNMLCFFSCCIICPTQNEKGR